MSMLHFVIVDNCTPVTPEMTTFLAKTHRNTKAELCTFPKKE